MFASRFYSEVRWFNDFFQFRFKKIGFYFCKTAFRHISGNRVINKNYTFIIVADTLTAESDFFYFNLYFFTFFILHS